MSHGIHIHYNSCALRETAPYLFADVGKAFAYHVTPHHAQCAVSELFMPWRILRFDVTELCTLVYLSLTWFLVRLLRSLHSHFTEASHRLWVFGEKRAEVKAEPDTTKAGNTCRVTSCPVSDCFRCIHLYILGVCLPSHTA